MLAHAQMTSAERRLSLLAIIAGCFGAGVGYGALHPLVALSLDEMDVSRGLIGANAALTNLAILIFGPFVPMVARRVGVVRALLATAVIDLVILALFPTFPNFWVWCVLRFAGGAIGVLWWVVTETWLNLIATDANRTRVFGLYGSALSSGFCLGPFAIAGVGSEGWAPWLIVLAAVALSALPIVLARRLAPELPKHPDAHPLAVLRRAPVLLAAAAAAGAADMAVTALLPLYGLSHGFSEQSAALMLTAFTVGTVMLQVPIGWAADVWSRRGMLLLCALLTVLGAALLPLLIGTGFALWALLVVWGGIVFAIYTVALGLLGERFAPAELAMVNAAFIMAYNTGAGLGPVAAGGLMEAWSPDGMTVVVAVSGLMVLLAAVLRRA